MLSILGQRLWGGTRRRSQRGELLLETIVTLVLIAFVIPALLLLASTVVVLSGQHRKAMNARNVATTIAESIDQLDYSDSCDPWADYSVSPNLLQVPAGYEQPVVNVRFMRPIAVANPMMEFQDACLIGNDQGVQEISVSVKTSGVHAATGKVVLIKRNDDCPAGALPADGQKC